MEGLRHRLMPRVKVCARGGLGQAAAGPGRIRWSWGPCRHLPRMGHPEPSRLASPMELCFILIPFSVIQEQIGLTPAASVP